jgi:hypothetical protein
MRNGAIIILLAALCFGAYVFFALLAVEPIKVAETHLIRSGDEVSVEGELRNTGADAGPLEVEIRYFDRSGRAIGNDKVAVGGLRSGGESHFRSVQRKLDGVADFSIYLNHGRNPYGN